jgi:hypothetical protein
MTRLVLASLSLIIVEAALSAQTPTPEYRVKAAHLLNFARYVEWPEGRLGDGPLTICVAGRNPFGTVLKQAADGETVDGRRVAVRVILEPDSGCHVTFVPEGAAAAAYLRAARGRPTLTVGESPDFITQGGIISFVREGAGEIRFDINQEAAERASLRIRSQLLRLARTPEPGRPER